MTYSYERIFTEKNIEADLKQGLLPIVSVKYLGNGGSHWVMIIGAKDGDFLIYDPLNDNKTPIPLSTHGKVFSYRVLKRHKRKRNAIKTVPFCAAQLIFAEYNGDHIHVFSGTSLHGLSVVHRVFVVGRKPVVPALLVAPPSPGWREFRRLARPKDLAPVGDVMEGVDILRPPGCAHLGRNVVMNVPDEPRYDDIHARAMLHKRQEVRLEICRIEPVIVIGITQMTASKNSSAKGIAWCLNQQGNNLFVAITHLVKSAFVVRVGAIQRSEAKTRTLYSLAANMEVRPQPQPRSKMVPPGVISSEASNSSSNFKGFGPMLCFIT